MRETAELFQGIFNQAAVGIAITGPDRKVVRANQSICDFLGYEVEELIGQTLRSATHPDFVPQVDEQIGKLVSWEVESATIENLYVRKDGTTVWGEWTSSLIRDDTGAPKFFISIVKDIDDRKKTEVEAEKIREMLEHSQRVANVGSWELDIAADEERWSDEAYRIFGLDPQSVDFTGYGFLNYVHPDDREAAKAAQDNAIARHRPYSVEFRILWPDGTERTVYEFGEVELDEHGSPIRLSGTVEDITERRQAELALKRTTDRLTEAQRLAHVGHWEWDPETDESDWSEETFRIFGLTPQRIPPGHDEFLATIIHDSDRTSVQRKMQETLNAGDPYTAEFRIVRPDGRIRTIFERAERYVSEETGRHRLRGVLQDITELKRAEANLREVSRRLKLAQRQAKIGYWRWSFAEERLTYWSEEAAKISRYPPVEGNLSYREMLVAVHPEDRPRVETEYRAADKECRDFSLEYRVVQEDGRITHVREIGEVEYDESGVPVAQVGFVQDITELRQLEQNLRNSEQQLSAFFTEAPAGLTLYDREGRYIKANETIARINGVPPEAHIGKLPSEILPLELAEQIEEANRRTLETGETLSNAEVSAPNPTARDEVSYYVWSRFPIPGPQGESLGVGAVVVDITDQKRAEYDLARLNAELEQRVAERTVALEAAQEELVHSERLATLGKLTATVSHELRNPLGAMRASLYVIEKKSENMDNSLSQAIARLNRSITRCDRIIDELLDYTRIRALDIEDTDLDEWLGAVLDEQPLPENVQVRRDLGTNGLVVPVDADRLRRAVVNIFDNACHAIEDLNGDGRPRRKPLLKVQTRIRNGRAELIFADNGSGIPEDKIEKIFEPLFSTKNFGVGLGLPVVRQIMEQHGGGVEVDRKRRNGAKFTLWLALPGNTRT